MQCRVTVAGLGVTEEDRALTASQYAFLRRLSATPAHPMMVLVAQVLVSVAQTIVGVGLAVGVAVVAFDLELPGDVPVTLAVLALTSLAMYGLGVLVAAVSPTPNASLAIGLIGFFAMMALGGGFGSRDALPDRLADIGGYLPYGAGMDVIGAASVGESPDGWQLLVLAVAAVVGVAVGVRFFRWQ